MTNPMTKKELYYGGFYAAFQFLVLPQLVSIAAYLLHLPDWGANVAMFAVNFLCTILIFRRFLKEALKTALSSLPKTIGYGLLGMVLYYAGTSFVSGWIFWLCPDFQNLNDASISVMAQHSKLFMLIGTVLFVPLAEETVFRGLLFRGIYDRSRLWAWLISACLFSLVHIVGYIGSYDGIKLLLAFLQYVPAGLALCLVYEKSDTIFAPVLAHAGINLIGMCLM